MQLAHQIVGEGPPLVLVHGALETGRDWERFLPELARHHRVHVLDLPGHGRSPNLPTRLSIPELALALRAWLQASELDRPVYVGHSLGGFLGLVLEARWPGTLGALALHAPKTSWSHEAIAQFRERLDPYRLMRQALRFAEQLRGRHAHPEQPERWWRLCLEVSEMVGAYRDGGPLSPQDLERLQLPIWLSCGGHDALFPPAEAAELARQLAGSELMIYPAAGHSLASLEAGVWTRDLGGFLAQAALTPG